MRVYQFHHIDMDENSKHKTQSTKKIPKQKFKTFSFHNFTQKVALRTIDTPIHCTMGVLRLLNYKTYNSILNKNNFLRLTGQILRQLLIRFYFFNDHRLLAPRRYANRATRFAVELNGDDYFIGQSQQCVKQRPLLLMN